MKLVPFLLLLLLAQTPAWSQPTSPQAMAREIDSILREHEQLGNRTFKTAWPGGSPKETYEKLPDGTYSYTRFYPTGGYAVRYQRKPGKAVVYERYFGNGKTSELLNVDPRIVDYTSYWGNGQKKCKYQANLQRKFTYYDARDEKGKVVYPRPR